MSTRDFIALSYNDDNKSQPGQVVRTLNVQLPKRPPDTVIALIETYTKDGKPVTALELWFEEAVCRHSWINTYDATVTYNNGLIEVCPVTGHLMILTEDGNGWHYANKDAHNAFITWFSESKLMPDGDNE